LPSRDGKESSPDHDFDQIKREMDTMMDTKEGK
jgi:hypothetical protein